MILKEFHHRAHRGHRGRGIISFLSASLRLRSGQVFASLRPGSGRALRFFQSCLPLLLLLPLTPITLSAQSPELVQAKARVKTLNAELEKLDDVIEQELESALAKQTDTAPKGEFETTSEHEARLAAAEEARKRSEPEYERKKADRRRAIQERIETLTSVPYPAPIRIRLGSYDADTQTFPFYVRATGDSGTIEIPREVAPEIKTNLPTLKQTGWWRVFEDGTEHLVAVGVEHQSGTYAGGTVAKEIKGTLLQTLTGHSAWVRSVAFSPDGQVLASGSGDKTIRLWRVGDPAAAGLLKTLKGHSSWVWSVAFSPDGKTPSTGSGQVLASGSDDKTIKLWRVSDGQLLRTLTGHSSYVYSVAFSPDGQTPSTGLRQSSAERSGQVLASGSRDETIKLWRASDGKLLRTLKGHSDWVRSVAFSPDGRTLASGSSDKTIKLWQVSDPSAAGLLRTLKGHSNTVFSVAFSPDGRTLASGSNDKTIKLWRTSDGKLLRTLTGHSDWVRSVAFSPDGRTLASGSDDHTIKLWRVTDGKLLKTLTGHSYGVWSVAFSLDGRTLASGSDDHTIKLWRVTPATDDQFLAAIRAEIGGAVAARGPSLPPALFAQVTFTEPSSDNILDANEEGTLAVTLTNTGQGAAYGVEVALRLSKGDVSGQGLSFPARRYVGEIPPGKSQQVSIPIKAGLDLPDGKATLTCTFSEANSFEPDPVEITFETRAYAPPQLALADVGVDEPSGNGMIEPGEVVTVMVRVQNRGRGAAEETKARVNIGKNVYVAEGSKTEFDLGTLPPGAFRDVEFQIYTNRRAKEIPVSVTLTERHGRYGLADAPLELPFNQPVRSIQQVVITGQEDEVAGLGVAYGEPGSSKGLSIDIEKDIPQGRDRRKNAVALIIANRRYLDPDVPDVTFAHRDGEFVKQYLVRTLGYREGNILVYRDATLSNFRTALKKLSNTARKGSDVFVYYTGHGAPDPEEKAGYFVPVDCDPNYVKVGGVALDEFCAELGEIKARSTTVVIDACFSGTSEAGMLLGEASPIFISVEDPAASLQNGVVLTSSSGAQISSWYPDRRHSLYTYYFLKGLQGAADQDGDRSLTVGELQTYLEEQVPYMARRLHNRQQTPAVTPGREARVLVRYE